MIKAALLFLALVIAGCSTTIQPYRYTATENDAEIYVYRDWTFLKSAVEVVLYVDAVPIAKLKTNDYVRIPINAGNHVIGVNGDTYTGENDSVSVVVEASKKYYFEVKPKGSQWLVSLAPPIAQVGTSPFFLEAANEQAFDLEKKDLDMVRIDWGNGGGWN